MVFKFDNTLSLVATNVNKHDVDQELFKKVFKDQNLGEVSSVVFEERSSKIKKSLYKATIYFTKWYDNIISRNFQERLHYKNNARIIFIDPWFWLIIKNPLQKKLEQAKKANKPLRRSLITELDWFQKLLPEPATPVKQIKHEVSVPSAPVKPALNINSMPFAPAPPSYETAVSNKNKSSFKKVRSSYKLAPRFMKASAADASAADASAVDANAVDENVSAHAYSTPTENKSFQFNEPLPLPAVTMPMFSSLEKQVNQLTKDVEEIKEQLLNKATEDYSYYCAENGVYKPTEQLATSCANSIFIGDDENYEHNQTSAATATNCANNVFLGDDENYEYNMDTKENATNCANFALAEETAEEENEQLPINLEELERYINIKPYCEGCELLMQGLGGENQLGHTCWQAYEEASACETAEDTDANEEANTCETTEEAEEDEYQSEETAEDYEIPHTDADICSCGDCVYLRQADYIAYMNYVNRAQAQAYYNYMAMIQHEMHRHHMMMLQMGSPPTDISYDTHHNV